MIRIGVIGYGYWGPNVVRNLMEVPEATVKAVCDFRADRLAVVQTRYPTIQVTTDPEVIFKDNSIDAVAICTPVSTHFDFAMQALRAGKHVLVEKPMATSTEECLQLLTEADRRKRTLMVDHTFVYTSAVQKMRKLIESDQLGRIYYYDSVRVNLGIFQRDVNVIWDLAVHDLSIMDYALPSRPYAVSATGISHVPGGKENIAYMTFFFEGNLIGHIHVNWLAPVKIRRTLIGGSRQMLVYDDLEPSEKIKVYDRGIKISENSSPESVYQMLVSYRSGDMWAPHLEGTEALRTEALEFVRSVDTGAQPITNGEAGMRLVSYLEAASQSMRVNGQAVEIAGGVLREVAV
jgi:predicted dehydrogenase